MNWDDLKVFLAVARSQSLSGAARILRLDPATVGRRIARLEARAGAVLFLKSPGGYAITGAGERLLPHAEAAEANLGLAEEALAGDDAGLAGLVRIGAPDGVANYLLPQVTARIAADNPGLEVQIVALPRVFSLTKREADMAVAIGMPTDGRLTVQKIADYGLHLAASRDYLARHGPIRTRDDLAGHTLVGYIPELIFARELNYLEDLGLGPPGLASNSVAVQMNWLRQGAGVGVIHDFAVPLLGGLDRILTDAVSLSRSLYLIRHADDRRRARLNRFADLLVRGLREEIPRLESKA